MNFSLMSCLTHAGAVAAFLACVTPASAASSLAGVWSTSVTLVNCSSGAAVAPPFTSLLAFAGDNTESEATNNPGLQPGQRSTGYGVWHATGANTYHMNTYALILFASSGTHPIAAGAQQIHQDITKTNNSFTSVATIQFFDTSGNLVSGGCATATAQRLS